MKAIYTLDYTVRLHYHQMIFLTGQNHDPETCKFIISNPMVTKKFATVLQLGAVSFCLYCSPETQDFFFAQSSVICFILAMQNIRIWGFLRAKKSEKQVGESVVNNYICNSYSEMSRAGVEPLTHGLFTAMASRRSFLIGLDCPRHNKVLSKYSLYWVFYEIVLYRDSLPTYHQKVHKPCLPEP